MFALSVDTRSLGPQQSKPNKLDSSSYKKMAMNGYVDGELDMMCEGLFDNIEDLLDFSTDDDEVFVESAAGDGGGGNGCQQIAPPPAAAAVLHSTNGEGSRVMASSEEDKICDDINICEDWITNFLDDSNFDIDFPATPNEIIAAAAAADPKDGLLFQSFSPVSVLEPNNLSNFSSSSSEKGGSSSSSFSSSASSSTNNETADTLSLAPVGPTRTLAPARARSKRPRRAAPAPAHVTALILSPASEGPPAFPTLLPECDSFGESPCPAPPMKKKKKKTLGLGAAAGDAGGDDGMRVRKCQHCGIQKTPQWRAGPMGPKSLCNACGVRYKSGRLFPEYRPAASPTYVPSLHSNSHKKVVEMRIKACQQKAVDGMPSPEYPAAKNCDLLAYIRRSE